MIAVVDSGTANLASVTAALERLGARADVTSDAARIGRAERVILPGVGAAAPAMRRLREKNLVEVLRALEQPVLGICLGMQLLFARSEEGSGTDCLDVISGTVRALKAAPNRPLPHMGWNELSMETPHHPLLDGIADGTYVYFVHGFAVPIAQHTLASCEYGTRFAAMVAEKNFFGCQFHPERSGAAGSRVLKNFLAM